ncbi:calcium-translocating P-type ATPase, PMCA-type [Prevotella copri]|jgi:Ca2+-transporting ATPase|uniref:P-type Ca(2+) transporter n=1 Tax=Segatella copri TaxID=165179 RepID=A0AAW5ISB1_9BACT|nr:calcium-translocating P-type ATPase, PMCA-type [Segatella copri]MCP9552177.1 calcium-translocating P-type ATPase, PMCA-type [Segatella copri]MCP9572587.1 calcium-translocating P-type ATPase, PMCA-type [Segatella copri]MCP9575679.1 calcium-translocating P-type ATPase, PMCA-type [Segatella copri]MCP9578624.1 calcium-translocating P-type ATPase, PMCA-type [Segatella copri]MCP9581483.1 calcium-translocating P-type ATPase, PMCA-type [Segatella copri]
MDIDKNRRIGLTDEQVKQSREQHGKNVLTPPQRTSLWKLYLDKYRDPIIQILLVAAFVSLILAFIEKNFMETIGIFVAVFLATTVGFYFERDAAKKFNLLTALSEEQPVKVRRNGKVMEIPRHDVVVGDVVLVEVGDEVPADGELIVCNDLQINESALTGEPVAEKSLEGGGDGAYPRNVILRSTMVMNGRGEFVVTAVGDATEIGKVAKKSTEQTSVETPLHMQLDKLAKMISKVGSVVSVAAFFIFLIHDILTNPAWGGKDYFYMAEIVLKYFMMAVTLIVMAVPEGLPMAITLSLALNMRRMLKSNNLVRKLHACETMGAVTVICTDKTGTLTQNKMQVSALELKQGDEVLLDTAIALNSTAELNDGKPIGNPTESALLLWLDAQGKDYEELRKQVNVLKQLPFSTERKMMATLAEVDGETYLFVKGAPEIVMKKCIIEDRMLRQSAEELDEWQHKAMRTLAFAYKKIEASIMRTSRTSTAEVVALLDANDLQLQAIAAIADPIRPDVPAAVQECRHAGIEVKVVTGDTAATALEIGKQIGVFEDEPENIGADGSLTSLDQQMITGEQWEALSDEEAYERAKDIRVMSRARPTDKQRLVAMLQKRGEVVAVTGDGTNDAPALHYAHVGLSLGSGTSVAKEASDMTLLDDSFKSIANAVMWGRSLYRNLQRFLFFQLVVNVAALLLVLGGSVIGTEMPLTVTQILWVNLIMDTFAALALASLPPSHEVMKDKPRKASDFIINKSIGFGILFCGIVFFLVMFALLVYCERRGKGGVDVHELTMFFTTFVMIQFWNLFNAKALMSHHTAFRHFLKDKGMILVLVLVLVGQWIIVTFGGEMFRTTPLSLHEWLLIIGSTSVVLWAGELWRTFKRMIAKRR